VQPTVLSSFLLEVRQTTSDDSALYHIKSVDEQCILAIVQQLLQQFDFIFAEPDSLPPSRFCDHSIPLITGARPVNIRPYRFSPAMKDEIESKVADMLSQGLIQHSSSAFSSPVLLVRKKDNTWRFCVDYRHLNALTLKSKYPVPIIDELLDELFGASCFSILDLRASFHQVLLKAGEEHKTAFQTHMGYYEFRVMAFGLKGAPRTFQRAMNHTLLPLLRKFALVFFDNILVYSDSLESHLQHLRQVFTLLAQDQWKVKRSKCVFAQPSVSYLGQVFSKDGVATDPNKIQAISSWPVPCSLKELRSFLGLAGYYRKFIRYFGVICQPLTQLLKKGVPFLWTSEHVLAFSTLKQTLMSSPVLALSDFSSPFIVETDASSYWCCVDATWAPSCFPQQGVGPKIPWSVQI
jgi:hypothetical protein